MFHNYEVNKLALASPNDLNVILLVILCLLSVLSLTSRKEGTFLDKIATDQVRGVAILLVVLGHLWEHVSASKPWLVMAGDGVALFLSISGYAISLKLMKRLPTFREFTIGRVNRVLLPYWIATLLILILDYVLLGKVYPISQVVLSTLAINLTPITHQLDYTRWFITFLIFWYCVVLIAAHWKKAYLPPVMVVCGLAVFLLDYYLFNVGWSQFFAFPFGCFLAKYQDRIGLHLTCSRGRKAGVVALAALCLIVRVGCSGSLFAGLHLHSVIVLFISDLASATFSISVILIFGFLQGFYSRFLILFGRYSYEIFLLHGVFLIKYNPIIAFGSVAWTFLLFLFFMLILSWTMNRLTNAMQVGVR
jgi:membrane-bound acyltransferase YfiQ involved in biofilm formation